MIIPLEVADDMVRGAKLQALEHLEALGIHWSSLGDCHRKELFEKLWRAEMPSRSEWTMYHDGWVSCQHAALKLLEEMRDRMRRMSMRIIGHAAVDLAVSAVETLKSPKKG